MSGLSSAGGSAQRGVEGELSAVNIPGIWGVIYLGPEGREVVAYCSIHCVS